MKLKEQFDLAASQCLSKNSRKTYWLWLLAFYRFTKKPASQWRGQDVTLWMQHLADEHGAVQRVPDRAGAQGGAVR